MSCKVLYFIKLSVILCLLLPVSGVLASDLLVGAWDFEDGGSGGVTADISGQSPAADGILGNAVIFNSGDPARGKALDCSAGGVKIPAQGRMIFNNTFTIQYWHKKQNPSEQWKYMVGCGGGGPRHFNMSGGMAFAVQTGDSTYNPLNLYRSAYSNPQQWHHVLVTYDGSTLYGYIDGQLVGTKSRGGLVLPTGDGWWSIGEQWNGDENGSWQGSSSRTSDLIDDVALWRGYLSAGSVQGLYEGTYTIYNVPVNEMPLPNADYPPADYDRDGIVEYDDLTYMGFHWLTTAGSYGFMDWLNYTDLAADWLDETGTGVVMDTAMLNGTLTFRLDGNFMTIPGFSHNHPKPPEMPTAEFDARGTLLHDFGSWDPRTCWVQTDPNMWNFGRTDQRITWLIEEAPNGQFVPWIYMGTPDWWLEDPANAGEIELLDDGSGVYQTTYDDGKDNNGPFPSFASTKWRKETGAALEVFIDYLYDSGLMERIAGFKVAGLGAGEWMMYSADRDLLSGYSAPTQEAFREWLREKYDNSVSQLQAAWPHKPGVTFDSAQVPSWSERRVYFTSGNPYRTFRINWSLNTVYMDVIDFERFLNELTVDTQEYFCRIIKEKTNGRKVVGCFYNYFYETTGHPEWGHNAQVKYNNSDVFDFVWVTSSYFDRSFGTGCDYQRGPGLSSQLHDKIFYLSNDTATHKASDRSDYDKLVLGYTDTAEKNDMMFRRTAGFNTTNGFYQEYLSLGGDYFDDPALHDIVGDLNGFYDRTKNYDRSSNAEILVVSDELSCSYVCYKRYFNRLLHRSLMYTQPELVKMGAQADHIFVDDIPLLPNPNRYKMVVFLNVYHASDQQRVYIDSLKGNNRLMVFIYAPGYFNGNDFGPALMESLTGMQLACDANPDNLIAPVIDITAGHSISNALLAAGVSQINRDLTMAKRFYVTDPDAVTLGTDHFAPSYTTMAIKDMGTWRSVYAILVADEENGGGSNVWRELARYAGVHIYSETNDAFYVNDHYVCLHPNATASRTVTFPEAVDVYDAMTETLLQSNTSNYTWNAEFGYTKLLRYEAHQ